MNATVTKTIEVYENEIDVAADFSYSESTHNEPFEHFGFRGSNPETETNFDSWESGVYLKGNLPDSINAELKAKIKKHLETLKPEDLWEESDCLDSLN